MTATGDAAARDRIRDAHDTSLFIEAGAGTGKTSALVQRVVALVATGAAELRHVAAITFTEAAAAELRDRVRAALEDAADGRDAHFTDPAARQRCDGALHELDDAALTTLHGFAHRILSDHPFEVGLPPGFTVLEEIEAGITFDQRWGAFVDELFADPAMESALTVWLGSGLTIRGLRPVAVQLCRSYDRLPAADPSPPLVRMPRADALRDALADLLELRRTDCRDDADLLASHIDTVTAARHLLADATEPLDILDAVIAVPKLSCKNKGRDGCWGNVRAAREACTAAEALRVRTIDEPRRDALAVLSGRLVAFARDYADQRRREGRLEFHDLLVLARNLLRDHADARRAVAARYQRLLLDEFQDTDPLQIEIAVLITADEPDPDQHPWFTTRIRPGALTLVGDPKQSIYRFRRADLGVYHEARECLGLEPVALTENFRSVPAILDVVNPVFEHLLTERTGVQAAHVRLEAHREPLPSAQVATIGAGHDALMSDIREQEAADVAAVVRQIVAEEWPVQDQHENTRPVEARDIALLIPSRTVLPALEAALEAADIPVRVESQSLVYATAEVRDLLSVLTAIDDPTDEVAVVASLRSPAFGCSDAQLVAHVEAGGGWDYRRDPPAGRPEDDPVAAGLSSLRGFWQERWWRSVSETVEAVVRERRLLELAARHRRPRDHWRRIRFLLDQARAWEDAGETSLRRFVEWAQRQADERARVNESVAPEPDDPALRILTVHGAKGLEFPVVVLAGLNTIPPNHAPEVVWSVDGPEIRVGAVNAGTRVGTPGYDAALADEKHHEEAERLRLLYVAMTRARDHLVVSLHHRVRRESHAAQLAPRLEEADLEAIVPDHRGRSAARAEGPKPVSADPAARDAWIASRLALVGRAGAPASVAATTLAGDHQAREVRDSEKRDDETEPKPPWQRGRAGTALGRAVHATLQTVDLATGADLDATARAQALAEGVSGREREVRQLVASVLASPIVRTAVENGWDRWREVPVAAHLEGVVLEGFVDLLLRGPDGLIVVDYKTDRAPAGPGLDQAVERYSVQAAAYALALEATLDEPVSRCVFVFAREPQAVERGVADLSGAMSEVRRLLRRVPVSA